MGGAGRRGAGQLRDVPGRSHAADGALPVRCVAPALRHCETPGPSTAACLPLCAEGLRHADSHLITKNLAAARRLPQATCGAARVSSRSSRAPRGPGRRPGAPRAGRR